MDPTTYQQACHSRLEPLPLLLFSERRRKYFSFGQVNTTQDSLLLGRTATQCQERYQKLLDEAEAKENEELRLAGPSDDIRRLQPAGPVLGPIEMFR